MNVDLFPGDFEDSDNSSVPYYLSSSQDDIGESALTLKNPAVKKLYTMTSDEIQSIEEQFKKDIKDKSRHNSVITLKFGNNTSAEKRTISVKQQMQNMSVNTDFKRKNVREGCCEDINTGYNRTQNIETGVKEVTDSVFENEFKSNTQSNVKKIESDYGVKTLTDSMFENEFVPKRTPSYKISERSSIPVQKTIVKKNKARTPVSDSESGEETHSKISKNQRNIQAEKIMKKKLQKQLSYVTGRNNISTREKQDLVRGIDKILNEFGKSELDTKALSNIFDKHSILNDEIMTDLITDENALITLTDVRTQLVN